MVCISYKNPYDFFPHNWISECMPTSNVEQLGDFDRKRGIFQGSVTIVICLERDTIIVITQKGNFML